MKSPRLNALAAIAISVLAFIVFYAKPRREKAQEDAMQELLHQAERDSGDIRSSWSDYDYMCLPILSLSRQDDGMVACNITIQHPDNNEEKAHYTLVNLDKDRFHVQGSMTTDEAEYSNALNIEEKGIHRLQPGESITVHAVLSVAMSEMKYTCIKYDRYLGVNSRGSMKSKWVETPPVAP